MEKLFESDNKYKAKVAGKGWLKGNGFVDDENEADTFESKTEPTQRINQMKKDGKLNKNAKITTKALKESTRGLETYADIINLKYDLIDEHKDIWGDNTADQMDDIVIRLGDTHGKGLAASGVLKNGKIGIIISPICAAFAKEDIDNIVLHELAHCAVYFAYGSFCRNDNGGHNEDWHYYVDQLNEKGFDIREVVDDNYLDEIEERMDKLQEATATKYMACCYDPDDYYEETNYIDEDGELKCNSSGAKLFDTEDEAIEYADDNRPYGWVSFAMPCNTMLDEATIPQAKRFAARKHGERNQIRKATGAPYIVHPEGVAALVKDFGGDDEQIQAAWLHDTMEDTGTWKDDLTEKFGDRVANIVAELTNDDYAIRSLGSKEDYMNQKLCHLSHDALLVKLCDMLYNHEDFPPMQQKMRIEKNIHYLMQNRELTEKEWQICNKIVSGD